MVLAKPLPRPVPAPGELSPSSPAAEGPGAVRVAVVGSRPPAFVAAPVPAPLSSLRHRYQASGT